MITIRRTSGVLTTLIGVLAGVVCLTLVVIVFIARNRRRDSP